jgi:mRNA-degrading endonuclease RelE of RelBE toxin-antitoxin system
VSHHVRLDRTAEKAFERLLRGDPATAKRIADAIDELAEDPYSPTLDRKPLRGFGVSVRIRVGDYRIVCEIGHDEVWISRIAHRREVYKH